MVIFRRVNAELNPEMVERFPGKDLEGKTAFFSDSLIAKKAETIKNLEVGIDNGIITVSGSWSDLAFAREILEDWLKELEIGNDNCLNKIGQEISTDILPQEEDSLEKAAPTERETVLPAILEKVQLIPKTDLDKIKTVQTKKCVKPDVVHPPIMLIAPVTRIRGHPSKLATKVDDKDNAPEERNTSVERHPSSGHESDVAIIKPAQKRKRTVVSSKKGLARISTEKTNKFIERAIKSETDILEEGEIRLTDIDNKPLTELGECDVEEPIDNEELGESGIEQKPGDTSYYNITDDKQYACTMCEYKSHRLIYLKNHVSRLHAAKRYKCPLCPKTFGLRKAYRDHYSYNHKNHQHCCDQCDKTFPKNYLLKAHIENQHTDKTKPDFVSQEPSDVSHKCPQCNFIAKHPRYLAAHKARTHSEKTLVCPLCDRRYATERDLKWHVKTHTFIFTCHVCGKQLKSKQALTQHLLAIHKEGDPITKKEKTYLCGTCGKLCQNKTVYNIHINKVHLNVKPHSCTMCGMAFYSKSSLKQHQLTHSDKRSFECDKCGKSFKQRQGLRLHQVIHRESRPHKCTECSKTFTQNGALVRHMRTHTGERPYPCSVCEATFSDYSILRRHLQGIHKIDDPAMVRKVVLESMNKAKKAVKKEPGHVQLVPRRGPGGKLAPLTQVMIETKTEAEMLVDTENPEFAEDTPEDGRGTELESLQTATASQELAMISQPVQQLYMENSAVPDTVFVQEGNLASDLAQGDVMEQVFVMNSSTEVISTTTDSKASVLLSPETLANVAAMYEHEGTIYALVQEQPLNT